MNPKLLEYMKQKYPDLAQSLEAKQQASQDAESKLQNNQFIQAGATAAGALLGQRNPQAQLYNRMQDLGKAPTTLEGAGPSPEMFRIKELMDAKVKREQAAADQNFQDNFAVQKMKSADEATAAQQKADAAKAAEDSRRFGITSGIDQGKLDETKRGNTIQERIARDKAAADAKERNQKNAMDLKSKYDGDATTKDTESVKTSYKKVVAGLSSPSPANDMAGIFSYMKMLDPRSTVREGEFANAQNAAGVPERILTAYNRALNGEILSPAQRMDFMKSAEAQYNAQLGRQSETDKQFKSFADQYGYPTEGIIGSQQAPAPAGGGIDLNSLDAELQKRGL